MYIYTLVVDLSVHEARHQCDMLLDKMHDKHYHHFPLCRDFKELISNNDFSPVESYFGRLHILSSHE